MASQFSESHTNVAIAGPYIFETIVFGFLFRSPKQIFPKSSEVFVYKNLGGSVNEKFF